MLQWMDSMTAGTAEVMANVIPVLLVAGLLGAALPDAIARYNRLYRGLFLVLISVALAGEGFALFGVRRGFSGEYDNGPGEPVRSVIDGFAPFMVWSAVILTGIYVLLEASLRVFPSVAGGEQADRIRRARELIALGVCDTELIRKAIRLDQATVDVLVRADLTPPQAAYELISLGPGRFNHGVSNEGIEAATDIDRRTVKTMRKHTNPDPVPEGPTVTTPRGRIRWRLTLTLGAALAAVVVRDRDADVQQIEG